MKMYTENIIAGEYTDAKVELTKAKNCTLSLITLYFELYDFPWTQKPCWQIYTG